MDEPIRGSDTSKRGIKMIRREIFLMLFLSSFLAAQELEEKTTPQHEFLIAGGTGWSSERSVFNVTAGDVPAEPGFVYYAGYFLNFTDQIAVGSQFYGSFQSIPNVGVTDASSNFRIVTFDLSILHIGLKGRYLFFPPPVQPYLLVAINLVSGSLENKDFGNVSLLGFSVAAAAGFRFKVLESVSFSIQGLTSFGSASFKSNPFTNSTGKDFNPSMTAVTIGVAYHWDS